MVQNKKYRTMVITIVSVTMISMSPTLLLLQLELVLSLLKPLSLLTVTIPNINIIRWLCNAVLFVYLRQRLFIVVNVTNVLHSCHE